MKSSTATDECGGCRVASLLAMTAHHLAVIASVSEAIHGHCRRPPIDGLLRHHSPPIGLEPRHGDLQLMFMAAAPQGQLNSISRPRRRRSSSDATAAGALVVEETGAQEFLGGRLTSDEGPFEALHLSCHGDIDPALGPVLLLETAEGGADQVGPGAIVKALGAVPPPLVFLSACRTAESAAAAVGGIGRRDAGDGAIEPCAARGAAAGRVGELARRSRGSWRRRIANVVGWDGSVYDADASAFARHFYQRARPLARPAGGGGRAAGAAAYEGQTAERGRHWHLARVYLGPQGGGPLCARGQAEARTPRQRREGLSRQGQAARSGGDARGIRRPAARHSGGAASVPGRSERRADPRHGGARQIEPRGAGDEPDAAACAGRDLRALRRACDFRCASGGAGPEDPPRRKRPHGASRSSPIPRRWPSAGSWLPVRSTSSPVLLIVDDLERILETPSQSDAATGVRCAYREALGAVLPAFDARADATRGCS